MSEQPEESSRPAQEGTTYLVPVRRARAPRYGVFIVSGVLAGLVAAVVLTYLRPEDPDFGRAKVAGYLGMALGLLGGLLGGLAAVLADRVRRSPR